MKFSEWAFDRIKLSRKVAKDEARKEHRPRNHDKKHRLFATHHRASGEARRRYDVTLQPPCCGSFPMDDYVWWSLVGKRKMVVRDLCRKNYD